MTLARKGGRGYDFHAGRKFRYPRDAFSALYFGKAGGTYIHDRGKFRYVYESD